ncbi:MAG: type II secretion system F family protein [Deltaproteobacteria bacterium]|nr:type II secretion system F family protein [Deltaproteobacteria bacterium]
MVILIATAFAAAVFFGAYSLGLVFEREKTRLKWFSTFSGIPKGNFLFTWNAPLISIIARRPMRPGVIARPAGPKQSPDRLTTLLKDSGLYSFCKEKEFAAFVFCLAAESAALFSLFFGFSFSPFFWGALSGAAYPFLWLLQAKKERFANIRRDLPTVMDLLAVSVSAGLDMMQALERIVAKLPKRGLVEEIDQMLHELKLGKTRKEVLISLKERVPLPEMKTLISFLVQAIMLGTSMGPVLIAGADQMRHQRFLDAEKLGIQASQKILFPLIFCILPAVFLTIFSPLVIRYYVLSS